MGTTWQAAQSLLILATVLASNQANAQLGSEIPLGDDPQVGAHAQSLPQIATTQSGGRVSYHVVWQDYRDEKWTIQYQELEDNGMPPLDKGNIPLSQTDDDAVPLYNAVRPQIATDGDQNVYVVWQAFGGGRERIVFRRIISGVPGTVHELNEEDPTEFVSAPSICADASPGQHVHVTWTQSEGTDQVFFATSPDNGANFDPAQQLPDSSVVVPPEDPAGHHESATVASDGFGNVYIAYLFQIAGGSRRVMLLENDAHGTSTFDLTVLDVDAAYGPNLPDEATFLDIVAQGESLSDRFVVVAWMDLYQDVNGGIHSVLVSAHIIDNTLVRQTYVSDPPATAGLGPLYTSIDLAIAGSDTVLAVYGRVNSPADQKSRVLGNRLKKTGLTASWGVEQDLTIGITDGAPYLKFGGVPPLTRPALAADGGNAVAVWMQSQLGETDYAYVMAACYDGQNNIWGSPELITQKTGSPGSSGSARAGFPGVALAGCWTTAVWDDRRHWTLPPGGLAIGAPNVYSTTFQISTCP